MAKAKKAKAEAPARVEAIAPIELSTFRVTIVGKKPLLMDKFPKEVAMAIVAKQTGASKTAKKTRDIEKEIEAAVHRLPTGEVGFPAGGLKAGMIEATSFVGDRDFSKKLIKGVKIKNAVNGLLALSFKKKDILEHQIGPNVKFSPQFHDWSITVEFEHDVNNISANDIITLLNYSGHYSGLGIWSPRSKCGGDFGLYEVKKGK